YNAHADKSPRTSAAARDSVIDDQARPSRRELGPVCYEKADETSMYVAGLSGSLCVCDCLREAVGCIIYSGIAAASVLTIGLGEGKKDSWFGTRSIGCRRVRCGSKIWTAVINGLSRRSRAREPCAHGPVCLQSNNQFNERSLFYSIGRYVRVKERQRLHTALEEVDTPNLNVIADDIVSNNDIDIAIGALNKYIRSVVKRCQRKVLADSDRRGLPADVRELIRVKIQPCTARTHTYLRHPNGRDHSQSQSLLGCGQSAQIRRVRGHACPQKPDNNLAFDDQERAEYIADSIELQSSLDPLNLEHVNRVENEVFRRSSLPPKDDLPLISADEVQKLIKELKSTKAPGLVGVNNKAIKCFFTLLMALLVAIFNAFVKKCHFPEAWKEDVIIGIPKLGKPRDFSTSYWPISLLSSLGKLFEKVFKSRQ
ncbi:RNA-directed DNA polymerase from mobile element jockey, partial [Eumeta japonica]